MRAESLVEDDLEEVDFYTSQGMYVEAMDSLRNLIERYPNHRLLVAKMREIEAPEGGIEPVALETPPAGNQDIPIDIEDPGDVETVAGLEHTGGTAALE